MLSELQIVNLAIIEKQTIHFAKGLNVISGETGAGKSIILEALRLILGGRGSSETIRTNAESLEVSAVFDLSNTPKELFQTLPEIINHNQTDLVLTRELLRNGKNKIYINGRPGTVSMLSEIAEKLINICGQHQSHQLFESSFHLTLVDSYGGHSQILESYETSFLKWQKLKEQIAYIESNARDLVMRRDGLERIFEELDPLRLVPGKKSELEVEAKRLSFAEQLISNGSIIVNELQDEAGISTRFNEISAALQTIVKIDPSISNTKALFDTAKMHLSEFEIEISKYALSINLDEEKLRDLQDRISDIVRLERKYRTDEAGLIKILDETKEELALVEDSADLDDLKNECGKLLSEVQTIGHKLRECREKVGKKLIKEVEKELAELNMKDARLKITVNPTEPYIKGTERIEFHISTNKGEEYRSIKQVASGGELSRIMLVLKKVLRERSGVSVLVFDEVDAGISGSVARAVGEKLKALSQDSQVICITHLAQVASLADKHLLVKKDSGVRTKTMVLELDRTSRVEEIARMLAGYKVTAASRASALELLSSNINEN